MRCIYKTTFVQGTHFSNLIEHYVTTRPVKGIQIKVNPKQQHINIYLCVPRKLLLYQHVVTLINTKNLPL